MPPAPLPFSQQSLRTTDSPITYFIQKALENPGLISLAAGLVDESSFPAASVAEAAAAIMADPATARAALQYGSTQGLPGLREKVLQLICAADGVTPGDIALSPDDVIITTGSQQLLYLLAEVLLDPGDIVLTEAPSYFVYHSLLQSAGVQVVSVPMDDGGLNVAALESILQRLASSGDLNRVKLIYTVDYFQNPTGLTLAAARRPQLVELARRYSHKQRILILEDAAYRELRFAGDDVPSIKRYDDRNEYVVYTSTFSKPCSPGLKTGYAIVPRDLVDPMLHLKSNHDFGSNNFVQHLLNRLIETGVYARHLDKLRGVYRHKCDVMLKELEREFGSEPGVRWTVPDGGLYVYVTLEGVQTGPDGPLVPAALDEGVLYVPGEFGHVPDRHGELPRNECRLSFGVANPEQISEGIRRFARAYRRISRRDSDHSLTATPKAATV